VPRDSAGLVYRFSKALEDMDVSATAVWGVVVSGVDEGDGWLRVGSRYLPMAINGTPVLTLMDAREYVVDNSVLQSDAPGVAYRLSRNMDHKDPREGSLGGPPFGTIVTGVDLGDGWLKVGERFLPMEIDGMRVLFERREEEHICFACGSILMDDAIFCRKCGAPAHGASGSGDTAEGAGSKEKMQKELDALYRELQRRMMSEVDANALAEPLAVPASSPAFPPTRSALLDFPITPHSPAVSPPARDRFGAFGQLSPEARGAPPFAPSPAPPSMTVKL